MRRSFKPALPGGCGQQVVGGGRHRAECGLDRPHEGIDVQRAGRGDDHVGRGVLAPHIAEQVVAGDALDVRAVADHRLAGGVQAVAGAVEQLERHRRRVFLDLGELVQDHLAFALEFVGREGAGLHDVGQQRHEGRQVAREAFDVERGVVLVGVRVDLGAEPFGIEVDALAVACGRALERHVFDDVADAVQPPRLVQAAGADEDAERHRLPPRHRDRDRAQAVRTAWQAGARRRTNRSSGGVLGKTGKAQSKTPTGWLALGLF